MNALVVISTEDLDRLIRAAVADAIQPAADPWVTIPDAMKALDVSRDTINRRIKTGQIETNGLSGKLRKVRL